MKKKLLFLMSLVVLAFTQCDPLDENDYSLVYDTSFIKHTAMVRFIDAANPNEPIDNIELTIGGRDADFIVESGGSKKFTIVNGGISLALDPRRKVTEGDPVSFRLKVKADGYLPINENVFFQEGEEQQIIELYMINTENTPSGVGNEISVMGIDNGVSNSPISVNLTPGAGKVVGAELTIPTGTEFRDVNGNKISGNEIEVSLTHFDPNGDISVNSFPGGFTPDTILNENGEPEDGFFNTAGFASIDMSIGGTEVRQFSQPIQVSMGVDPNTKNLEGNTVQLGDEIPIWSYEVETGQWKYERTGTVVDDGNGGMKMDFETDHLSWYNIDYYGRRCNWYQRARVRINMPGFNGYSNGQWMYGELVFASNNQPVSYYASRTYRLYDNAMLNFMNAPNATVKFRVYSGTSRYSKGNLIAESAAFNACSGIGQVNVNVTPPTQITFDVVGKCPNEGGITFRPNFYVYYKEKSASYYSWLTYLSNGRGSTTKLELNNEYDFMVWYNGELIYFSGTIDKLVYNDIIELSEADCELIGR